MLRAKEFIERGAPPVLRNLVLEDTSEWQTQKNTEPVPVDGVKGNRSFYVRMEQKIRSDLSASGYTHHFSVHEYSYVNEIGYGSDTIGYGNDFLGYSYELKEIYNNDQSDIDTRTVSGIFSTTEGYQLNSAMIWHYGTMSSDETPLTDQYRSLMLIDLTNVFISYPSLAQVSTEELKILLDTVPYFTGYYKFDYEDPQNNKRYSSFEQNRVRSVGFFEGAFREKLDVYKNDPFFDQDSTTISRYNNSNTNTPVLTKITAPDDYPLKDVHSTVYKLSFDRTLESTPGLGGYVCMFTPHKLGIFEDVLYIKAPKGLQMTTASNYISSNTKWLNRDTTGEWQEGHVRFNIVGDESSSGGHIYFTILPEADVPEQFDVYLGAATVLDITDNPDFFYTPLFDPSLGARMTPGGLLHSGAFIEDSAISSVQVSRGGVRRIPEITLHNMVTVDTTNETVKESVNIDGPQIYFDRESLKYGHPYYFRASSKYDEVVGKEVSETVFYLDGEYGIGMYYANPAADTWRTKGQIWSSWSFKEDPSKTTSFWLYPRLSEGESRTTTVYGKEVLLIDLTELYKVFPSFAALSETDQKAILDTLPYFFGDMTLGGELENFSLDNAANNTYGDYGKYQEENGEKIFTLDKTLPQSGFVLYNKNTGLKPNSYFYLRSTYKTSNQVDFGYYNFCGVEYSTVLSGSGFRGKNLSTIPLEWQTNSMLGKRTSFNNSNFQFVFASEGYKKWPDGETAEVRFKESVLINLTAHGHYTLYRLMGMTDADIKEHLDSLPFFQKSIPFPTLIDDQKKLY